MLSHDELSNGTVFVLKLWDVAGVPSCWAETLRGETARRWYNIYRGSDWEALRAEAAGVFRNPVTEAEVEGILRLRGPVRVHPHAAGEGGPTRGRTRELLRSRGSRSRGSRSRGPGRHPTHRVTAPGVRGPRRAAVVAGGATG